MVPLTGTGTNADPIRPEYVPAPPVLGTKPARPAATGIIGFHFVISDDKKHAIVEFVARDRSAFNGLMADRRPDVKVFDKGTAKRIIERQKNAASCGNYKQHRNGGIRCEGYDRKRY